MAQIDAFTFFDAYPVAHHRLDNGLEVLLLDNPLSPVAAYLTHYTVGSASEAGEERGLAHFFEHMMFRETDTLHDGDFDRVMAEIGGVGLNAFTSYDTTAYHVNVPSAHLGRVIGLEADRMANLHLSPELIEVERGAVLGEMRMYQDMPSEQFWNALMAEAFPQHPYRHPIIGYADQVSGFRDTDFAQFYAAHYAPNRAVIVVAGGIDGGEVLHLIEEAYGGLPPGAPRPEPVAPDAPWAGPRRIELRHEKITTEYLMLAWRTPGVLHADLPALELLAAVLGAGHASPLYRVIVAAGLGTHAVAHVLEAEMNLASPGLLLVDVALQHGIPAEQAEEAVQGELTRLHREGITPEALERARNQLRLSAYGSLGTNMSLARQLGGAYVACGNARYSEQLLQEILEVTPEQLLAVLKRYLLDAPALAAAQRPVAGGAA